ncbi:NRDE-2, necessary for RNA interference-domain-containing protein [Roridomyces roridus]|uniref:NRDE-2, necessary for RNA interference-domain-containing protein n=1 Tax=Roridomyces roridus TaxID=1738132 RepID=A0AAD7BU31_9AGAR|nr:NRDE-2, necessary for RNA interference-domain-containing protein [Roridomyces roridus]
MNFPSFPSFPELPSSISPPPPPKKKEKRSRHPNTDAPGDKKQSRGGSNSDSREQQSRGGNNSNSREPEAASSRLFYSDRKGDPLNIQYGRLSAREVPKYHTGKFILGLPPSFAALSRGNAGIEVGLLGKRKRMPSLTDASSRALLSRNPTRILVNPAPSSKYQEHDGFLRLPSRAANEQSYRSIDNTEDKSDSESGAEESDGGDSDSSQENTPNSYQATMNAINERLAAQPHIISNWLSLLSHTLLTVSTTSKNATRARSEISISILSRALEAAGNLTVLRLKYLQAGEEIWHESKLRAEWEQALQNLGRSTDIWSEWFEWRIRTNNKGVAAIVEDAKRALAALHHDGVGQVRIFWRLAVAVQLAGFGERATAMFQAQAELTFHSPQGLDASPLAHRLDALEEFWESECPRIGEPGSKGWNTWHSSGRSSNPPPPPPKPAPLEDLDPYRKFGLSESLSDRILFLPRRSTDSEADLDPYCTILFTDVRDVLLNLNSPHAKEVFRYAWLAVLGLNLPGFTSGEADDRWCHTYMMRPAYLDAIFPSQSASRITSDAIAGVIVGREREYNRGLGGPISSWGWQTVPPLEVPSSDGKYKALWSKDDLKGIDPSFVRNVFRQLRLGNADLDWDFFHLSFEAAFSLKSALKLSREFLSTAPDSLGHWAAYARLERLRGRPDDARKVYETVLSSHGAHPDAGRIWWDWAEMEWLSGQADAALKVVLRSAQVEGSGGVVILRAKRNLDDAARDGREPFVKLKALLELLTNNTVAALEVFDGHLSTLKVGSAQHESLLMVQLLMLHRHTVLLKNPTPPALLRQRVEASLQLYPSNSVVLGLFLEGEKGQGVWGKVRAMLGESPGAPDKDVLRRAQEVWIAGWEKGRWEAEAERTRSGLAAAVESERTKRSALIWCLYIQLEIKVGQLNRAKKLLFRAIGDCPLVKELYLIAFGPLRSVFSAAELNGFADTMVERELRLRRGLDEFLEGWALVEDKADSDSEQDNGDEIEMRAREYRQRLPY